MNKKNSLEFEITIGRKFNDDYWPINVRIKDNDLPRDLSDLNLKLNCKALRVQNLKNNEYGQFLGKALFDAVQARGNNQEELKLLRDHFKEALGKSSIDCPLRILLSIDNAEDEELKTVEWQRLCAPINADGSWSPLALDQRVPFAMYIPTAISTNFPVLRRQDLRALVLVASPDDLSPGLADFDVKKVVSDIRKSLGDIPHKILANNIDHEDCIGAPTLTNLCQQLTDANPRYNLLHIVCHGTLDGDKKDTILYWADENNQASLLSGEELITNLITLPIVPHFAFLCACNSAAAQAEVAKEGETPLGGLAQRLVRKLGMPAVVAMTREVTIETASELTERFYPRLRQSGEVDIALKEATAGLGDRYNDITVPVLFSRLGARPLFISDEHFKQDLQQEDIRKGIEKLTNLFKVHSPLALKEKFEEQKKLIKESETRPQALKELNNLCYQVFDLTFDELAMGENPPIPQEVECPFPGLSSFGPEEFHKFFFGREALIQDLKNVFGSGETFLAVLGNSGTGKSSLVLAGLIPALKEKDKELMVKCITPGNEPLKKLDEAISELSGDSAILVVDQFEELFTFRSSEGIPTDEEIKKDQQMREEFIKKMFEFAEQHKVVMTMRADFLGECANYKALKNRINNKKNFILVGPMETQELAEVIQKQANAAGLRFEAGLNTLILADLEQEPGAMPLLQYALKLLYERRCGRWLCGKEYIKIGGVGKAITTIADNFYDSLKSEAEKEQVKNIFLRLTHLQQSFVQNDQHKYTRERVYLESLSLQDDLQKQEEIQKLVDLLAGPEARLLVKSRPGENLADKITVEVAHEALITHWGKLQKWLQEDSVNLLLRQSIGDAAFKWEQENDEQKKYDCLLHHGFQLKEVEKLLNRTGFFANNHIEYVKACREKENCQKGKELEQVIANHITYSKLLFVSHQRLDALAELIKAGEKLQQGSKIDPVAEFSFLFTFGQMYAELYEFNSLKVESFDRVCGLAMKAVDAIACHPKEPIIAFIEHQTIKLWHYRRQEIQTLDLVNEGASTTAFESLSFSFDGNFLAFVDDNEIKIWQRQQTSDPHPWKLVQTIKGYRDLCEKIVAFKFSPQRNIIAYAIDDTIILCKF